ncbi:DNA-binding protein [Neptuniibacter sp. QD37_11]|uniref:DNA-binding protein n=1 Tax=Neptuniibacter sp. QD37_11 TaxID=3398209 RepID=UPI0039F53DE1
MTKLGTAPSSREIEIFEACSEIHAQGLSVSAISVRNKIGGGSFSTISPVVKAWKEKQKDIELANTAVPDEVMNELLPELQGLLHRVWHVSSTKHNALMQSLIGQQESKLKTVEADSQSLEDEVVRQEKLIDNLTKQLDEKALQHKELEEKVSVLQEAQNELVIAKFKLQDQGEKMALVQSQLDEARHSQEDALRKLHIAEGKLEALEEQH